MTTTTTSATTNAPTAITAAAVAVGGVGENMSPSPSPLGDSNGQQQQEQVEETGSVGSLCSGIDNKEECDKVKESVDDFMDAAMMTSTADDNNENDGDPHYHQQMEEAGAGTGEEDNDGGHMSIDGIVSVTNSDQQHAAPMNVVFLDDNAEQQQQLNSNNQLLSGRFPVRLYLTCDDDNFTPYQVLMRKQIELFEALPQDLIGTVQGRNREVQLGQVGIRCIWCSNAYIRQQRNNNDNNNHNQGRTKGSVYYPTTLLSVYQAAQNMTKNHLLVSCPHLPDDIRNELLRLRNLTTISSSGGKEAWAKRIKALGVYETNDNDDGGDDDNDNDGGGDDDVNRDQMDEKNTKKTSTTSTTTILRFDKDWAYKILNK